MKRADIVSVRKLLSGGARYRCGTARSGFTWQPPQVAQLLVDIETLARDSYEEEDVPEERLYLGVMTVTPQKSGHYVLLDGRQRLIVLTMYLAFARDRLPTNRERNAIDRLLVRRAFGRPPEPRLRLAPEDHAWLAHFILPPGATKRLPAAHPIGSPKELLLAARFMEHAFASYSVEEVRNFVDFLLHHTAVVRSIDEHRSVTVPSNAPSLQSPRLVWSAPEQEQAIPARYRAAAE